MSLPVGTEGKRINLIFCERERERGRERGREREREKEREREGLGPVPCAVLNQ